ncbi:o-succinylbenzoate--CoA ligase [Endozoicomonas arenosclerae]|uniref:o-succinylbenzoate--CoA ligase n=1 Tax=Endozoicomonas arenosclerae TaxID=1633495 RepID=UPI0009A1C77E|nr:o-succinylbenzoate--CoA ligase [Endozoicomonas arenosclerae]
MELSLCPLREWTINDPRKVVIRVDDRAITRAELDSKVELLRDCFREQGVQKGDRIIAPVTEALDAVILIFACLRSGWVYCPVNPQMPDDQKQQYCQKVGAQWSLKEKINGVVRLEWPCQESRKSENLQSLPLDITAICDLIATSGTTGVPKAVSHTFSNHIYSAEGSQQCIPLTEGDSWLLSLPLFHVGGFGIVIRCLLAGAEMVVDTQKTPLNRLLQRERISHISLVNTQLHRLLVKGAEVLDESGLKCILVGGGFASPELVSQVQKKGIKILTTYGMTEMSSQVCTGVPGFVQSGVTSGKPLPHREVTINGSGEILVRGRTLSPGYFQRGALLPLVDEQGWYHSGDLGQWIDDQILVIGRIDNMLISGGENIHPEEIEKALLSIDDIIMAVVVSVKDDEYGQRPFAFVQTESGSLNEVFTKQKLAGTISRFKIPDRIRLLPVEQLPSGLKPNRQTLQSLADRLTNS